MTAIFNRRFIPIILIVGVAHCETSFAQKELPVADVFSFAAVKKTPAHPYYGLGSEIGFLVNGVEGPTLYFVRDSTYAMHFDTLTAGEFPYAYTDPSGGFFNRYRDVEIGDYFEKHYLYWRATEETPDTLYYGNIEQTFMGGMIVVVDSLTTSVREARASSYKSRVVSNIAPNPVRDAGMLSFAPLHSGRVQIQIVDVVGRIVSESGYDVSGNTEARIRIDGSDLTTGIYFYRVIDIRSGNDVITSGSFHVQ